MMTHSPIQVKLDEFFIFEIKFVSREENKGNDGRTWHNQQIITISNDMNYTGTLLCIVHELVHAILGISGRVYQDKFNVEELCEFVAYKYPLIHKLVEEISGKLVNCEVGQGL